MNRELHKAVKSDTSHKSFQETLNEALLLKKNFTADPNHFIPCLDCGKAIAHADVKEVRTLLCCQRCYRRFNARMKSLGRDTEKVLEQALRDAFGVARGRVQGQLQNDPFMLPNREALLLNLTGHLVRPLEYQQNRNWYRST